MLEIYRQFSVGLQVYYFESMLTEIYDLLRVYERANAAKIVNWPKIAVDEQTLRELGYDPSLETEVKNQPTAYNDCLLRYKDAAEFIMFGDTDDVLYPRKGRTYLEEFRLLSRMFPAAGAFLYPRYTGNFESSRFTQNYSLRKLINSVQITDRWVSEKYVGIPSRVKASFIHWPAQMETGFVQRNVPRDFNMMVHFRRWRKVDKSTGILPRFLANSFRKSIN
ncbi:Protein F59C6.8, partial [Aphelenchoides avenae]